LCAKVTCHHARPGRIPAAGGRDAEFPSGARAAEGFRLPISYARRAANASLNRYDGCVDPHIEHADPRAEPPEVAWARRLLAGDASAFTPFVESFQAKIFQYTFFMCGHREDAEEVAQETLMRVFGSFDQLRDPAQVKAWVFRIAKNYCLMKRRRSVFAPTRELSLDELHPSHDGEGAPLQLADEGERPDAAILRGELGERLEQALRALPDTYRSVVLLRDVEELSTAETASILDITEDNVKQRLHRGRLALRRELAKYLEAVP
jgi:RNA polymerase sigma-70 factor, ECF subfamily